MFRPKSNYFKPQGIPMYELEEVVLEKDEMEAVRLCDKKQMDMLEAAEKMKLSKSTVHRLLSVAHRKIADAMVEGKALRISE
jgi:predicted DNA-binding protein (UPF0251 family)